MKFAYCNNSGAFTFFLFVSKERSLYFVKSSGKRWIIPLLHICFHVRSLIFTYVYMQSYKFGWNEEFFNYFRQQESSANIGYVRIIAESCCIQKIGNVHMASLLFNSCESRQTCRNVIEHEVRLHFSTTLIETFSIL